ncbi:MAG: tRNA (adenosine(37)-N6)-threonylcarbamoyltransferase complex dimerization subunit type 1 TsaB [Cryobacterium sp.]|nr:tRNA (adenosine(37)-N6)-threonylcarbamoyltransferase complex dimerization subunit type 1 TsaB [Oligoflexia bacterium]
MKKLLAWDTSSKVGALVAIEWGDTPSAQNVATPYRLVSEWTLNVDAAQHSERLLWGVHQMLEACAWKLSDVDFFGVGTGPGSFTGLRIGVTTARTLALTLGKPLVGVSSLAALARPVGIHYAGHPERVIVVATTDAAKGELFTLIGAARSLVDCVAKSDGDFPGIWKRGVEEQVLEPDAIVKSVKKKLSEGSGREKASYVRVGEGRTRYDAVWKTLPTDRELECGIPFIDHVQGRFLGQLCYEAIQAGLARSPLDVHPRYLRVADAEKKLLAGLLKPSPMQSPLAKKDDDSK